MLPTRMFRNGDPARMHIFTTHFFTTLDEDGPEGVTKWTERKGIDVFSKKFIYIPINEHLHWSLAVVVNPGKIVESDEKKDLDDEAPVILFLDSLKAHRASKIGRKIRNWLNSEWVRLRGQGSERRPFDKDSIPLVSPNSKL